MSYKKREKIKPLISLKMNDENKKTSDYLPQSPKTGLIFTLIKQKNRDFSYKKRVSCGWVNKKFGIYP